MIFKNYLQKKPLLLRTIYSDEIKVDIAIRVFQYQPNFTNNRIETEQKNNVPLIKVKNYYLSLSNETP
jgi:hypothetical protein